MITFTSTVNNIKYKVDAWVRYDSAHELYKLGIQAIPLKGKIYSFSGNLPEEFVEDVIHPRGDLSWHRWDLYNYSNVNPLILLNFL